MMSDILFALELLCFAISIVLAYKKKGYGMLLFIVLGVMCIIFQVHNNGQKEVKENVISCYDYEVRAIHERINDSIVEVHYEIKYWK